MSLENNSQTFKLKAMLLVASERLESNTPNVEKMYNDIKNEFSKKKISDVIEAVRLGSLGKYGVNYKLTTQVVCYWIRCYTEPKIDKL